MCERILDAVHDVRVILAPPFAFDAALKFLAVARRAARVRIKHGPTARRIDLKLVKPINAVLAGRAAMHAQDQRILFALVPADGFDEKAVNVPTVRALVSEAFNVLQLQLPPESLVEMRQLSLVPPIQISNVKIIQMFEIIDSVNHAPRLVVDVCAAHGPRTVCDLLHGLRVNDDAKDLILAFDARAEIERAPLFSPSEIGRDQIEVARG